MWYREGTIVLTPASRTVTGVGTKWAQASNGVLPGMILLAPDFSLHEIRSVVSDTELLLVENYTGVAQVNMPCRIITTYEGDISQFSARFSATLAEIRKSSDIWSDWTQTDGIVDILNLDGSITKVDSLPKVMREHAARVEWFNDNQQVIDEAGDRSREAAASAAEAKTSEGKALASQNAAAASQTAAKTSETNSKTSENSALASKTAAATSETNALASKNAAAASQTAAKTSETNAGNSATASATSAAASLASQTASANSAAASLTSQNAAKTSENNAKTSETNAATSQGAALVSQNAAKTSETNAASSAAAALASKNAAGTSETNASASAAAALSSKNAAKTSEDAALASKNAAGASQTASATSATNSATSAAASLASQNAAKTSETNAASSKTAAANSATAAAGSATAAGVSQNAAAASAEEALDCEDKASNSAAAALVSQNAAKASETSALASKTAAGTSETNALASKNAAATSATNSANSATASATSATNSAGSATASDNSAKASATSAAASLVSQNAAKASESAALASKNAAKTSEDAALLSETAAATSATAAADSEANASASKTAAATSATASANSATAASASKDAAKTSETNAKTSETNASASKTAAATSATASANSATASAASEAKAKTSETNAMASELAAKEAADLAIAGQQPKSDTLTSLSTQGAAATANQLAYFTGKNALALTPLTAFVRDVLGKGTAADVRTTLETYSKAEMDLKLGTKTHTIDAPPGVELDKYYPLVLTGPYGRCGVQVLTRSSSGTDPMNHCSFSGQLLADGWSDRAKLASGTFGIYATAERAIHSLYTNSNDGGPCFVFYIHARAFPVTVLAMEGVNVRASGVDFTWGQSIYPAGISTPSNAAMTNAGLMIDFSAGSGFYTNMNMLERGVRVYSPNNKPTPAEINAVPTSLTVNSKPLTGNIVLTPADIGSPPTSLTINNKPLTANVSLSPADIGALSTSGGAVAGAVTVSGTITPGSYANFDARYPLTQNRAAESIRTIILSLAGSTAGWHKIATLTMPQAVATAVIELHGGAGYNAAQPSQAGSAKIVLRTGNNSPKGINAFLVTESGRTTFSNVATVNTSGNVFDVYVSISGYATALIASVRAVNATVDAFGRLSPEVLSTLPEEAVIGSVEKLLQISPSTGAITGNPTLTTTGDFTARTLTATSAVNAPAVSATGLITPGVYTNFDNRYFQASGLGAVQAATGVAWNAKSGLYNSANTGDSDIVVHYYQGTGSCPTVQIKARYRNGGLWYRSARDGAGFENDWSKIYTTAQPPSSAEVGALALTGGSITGNVSLAGNLTVSGTAVVTLPNGITVPDKGTIDGSINFLVRGVCGSNDAGYIAVGATALNAGFLEIGTQDDGNEPIYVRQRGSGNVITRTLTLLNESGNTTLPGTLNAAGTITPGSYVNFDARFLGIAANATSATKLATARTIAGVAFDGTANIALTAANVNALPLTGGTVSGAFTAAGDIKSNAWVYGNKVVGNNTSGSWISMRDANGTFISLHNVANDSASAIIQQNHNNRKFFVGGLGNSQFGFYMIENTRTANGTDANAYLQNDGRWIANGGISTAHLTSNSHTCSGQIIGSTLVATANSVYVRGGGNCHYWFQTAAGAEKALLWTGDDNVLRMRGAAGQVQIGGTTYGEGNGNFNDVYIRSDIRLKRNLRRIQSAGEKVEQLNGYHYDKKLTLEDTEYTSQEVGLIAQELRDILPEAVNEDATTGVLTISNSAVNALLVEVVKELRSELRSLKAEVHSLQAQIATQGGK